MPYDISSDFINAFLAGQQHKDQLQMRKYREQQMQNEQEDRVIEKELLQHRIRELKIGEKVQARDLARQNIQTLQGTPTADLTPEMTEGGVLPASSPMTPESLITLMKQQQIPGVEELGVPGVSVRPQTQEQVTQTGLAKLLQEQLIKQRTDIFSVPQGAAVVQGGKELYRNPREEEYVKIRRRGKDGKLIETLVPKSEAIGLEQEMEQLPSNSTTINVSGDDLTGIAEAIMRGERPADLSGYRGQDRIRIDAMLAKNKFNTTRAIQDQKAVATNLSTLNGAQVTEMRITADALDSALTDLEAANEAWDRTALGPFSWANILIAKGKGGEAAEQAKNAESAARAAAQLMTQLQAGGSATTNQALIDAAKILNASRGQEDLRGVISRARTAANYRTAAIRGLEAITTDRETNDPLGLR